MTEEFGDKATCSSENNKTSFSYFFQVAFAEALELVRQRKVFLKDGFAYVPESDLATLVTSSFRTSLSRALTVSISIWLNHLPPLNGHIWLIGLSFSSNCNNKNV